MSTPLEKACSEPAKMMALISGRASICSSAARSSSIIVTSMTFSGGLFSVMRAAGGLESNRDAGKNGLGAGGHGFKCRSLGSSAAADFAQDDNLKNYFPVNLAGRFSM